MGSKASLSATNLAVYHHHQCDLYLHNVYHRQTESKDSSRATSLLSEANFKRGLSWEDHLFKWLDRENLLLTVPSALLDPAVLYENIQADSRDHFFIAGLSFSPPNDQFEARFREAGKMPVRFGIAKPDLLEIFREKDVIKWKVIDAKVSSRVKTSHHVQLYFYTLCLSLVLPYYSFSPEGSAGIWLPPSEGFEKSEPSFEDLKSINYALLSSSLDQFFFDKLPDIISASIDDVRWHYNPQCQSCPYEHDCKSKAQAEGRLGSMANISMDDAQTLRRLLRLASQNVKTDTPPVSDIEDLHRLVAGPKKLEQLSVPFPSLIRQSKRILGLPKKGGNRESPVVEAARSRSSQVKLFRSCTLPRNEDVAVVISLKNDLTLTTPGIERYTITIISRQALPTLQLHQCGPGSELVPTLSSSISKIISEQSTFSPNLTTQFYVWSGNELSTLQRHLITTALTSNTPEQMKEVRTCIGALAQGTSLLQTAYQPLLLSGTLLNFLTHSQWSKAEVMAFLERMELSTTGTLPELRARAAKTIQQIQSEGGRAITSNSECTEFGQLPRVVVLQRELEHLIALPLPGYWDLSDCASVLLPETSPEARCPTNDQLMLLERQEITSLDESLKRRNLCMYAVLQDVRRRISEAGPNLLVNSAKVLSSTFMDLCRQEDLRKLFFVQQFEVLTRLYELWRTRIEGCPDAPVLEYVREAKKDGVRVHVFRLISGTLDVTMTDKNLSMYDKILVPDEEDNLGNDIPVEALFDDLAVSGVMFPLNDYNRSKWDSMHETVRKQLYIVDVRNIGGGEDSAKPEVILHACQRDSRVNFVPYKRYRISPRLVDFNTSKNMAALLELDLQWSTAISLAAEPPSLDHRNIPLIQMIMNPGSFQSTFCSTELLKKEQVIQKMFRELKDLGVEAAGSLILKSSQHRAAKRILSQRLSVIWGPPGTGKTYTIALSLLRLLDAEHRLGDTKRKIIFVTAMTHAAIDAVRTKIQSLMASYRAIESLPTAWLDRVCLEHVQSAHTHRAPSTRPLVYIYAGTTYQLYKFSKKYKSVQADCIIVDEAGQLGLSSLALVLRALSPDGRIILAGDSEQLAPILSANYPKIKDKRPIFGSVLDCLMYAPKTQQPTVTPAVDEPMESQGSSSLNGEEVAFNFVQLTENFRLNPDLGEFVSTIYSKSFKPQKLQARQLAQNLKLIENFRFESSTEPRWKEIQPDILISIQTFLFSLSKAMLREPQSELSPPRIHNNATIAALSAPLTQSGSINIVNDVTPPQAISLALLKLHADSRRSPGGDVLYDTHVRGEAEVATALVKMLMKCSPEDDIFVATPHRAQRDAVKAAFRRVGILNEGGTKNNSLDEDETLGLEKLKIGERGDSDGQSGEREIKEKVRIDTIERLQGSEAAFVICLFTAPKTLTSQDLSFLLERRRLNVAISRAKTLCIVVTSPNVLRPGVNVLANEETTKGYAFLKAFEERAWSFDLDVDLDRF
ncbi:hypothetical protein H0H93_007484 [Arthromyces matolae]|nr:hypothetical protein H0H93_007484 [Arthromyces matolae]